MNAILSFIGLKNPTRVDVLLKLVEHIILSNKKYLLINKQEIILSRRKVIYPLKSLPSRLGP